MKINYTMYSTSVNGGHRVILEITNGLVKRGHEVSITTFGSPPDTTWCPPLATMRYVGKYPLDVRIRHRLDRYLHREWIYPIKRLSEILARAVPECDINVATYSLTAYVHELAQKGRGLYHMQHYESLFVDDVRNKEIIDQTYSLPLTKIANSTWLKRQIETKFAASHLPVICPALDHHVFCPRTAPRETQKIRVISLARPERWKGFPDLLKAMELVQRRNKQVEWIVFGVAEPPYKSSSAPYTFIKSPVNHELAELYASCHIAVNPSWYESFPLPPLEAMACGVAVVTTPYGTEDYARDGDTALVVPPKDSTAMADAITRLVQDKSLRLSLRERGLMEAANYTWDNTVNAVEAMFVAAK